MFKKLFFAMVILGVTVSAHAEGWRVIETVASEDTSTAVDVPTTLTRYSKSFSFKNNYQPIGVWYKATSDGVVTVTLQAQQSYKAPTTELAADTSYTVWETAESVVDESWHVMTLDTVAGSYGRFKLTGTGSNDATTEIQFKVIKY
jgi:hypothetical protein